MITSTPLACDAVPRIGGLQPLVAVLPAALSRHGVVWSPEPTAVAVQMDRPVVEADFGPREESTLRRHHQRARPRLMP